VIARKDQGPGARKRHHPSRGATTPSASPGLTYSSFEARDAAGCFQGEGWALVDGLVGGELVHNVRREIKQLESQYEAGEIWVGKQADVGAQISVSSVRGDRVLWVDKFGLHDGPFASLRELVCADFLLSPRSQAHARRRLC
jgi:hypothetical protein